MFCGPHNNYCGAGAQPAYTSDAGFTQDAGFPLDNGFNGMTTLDNGMNFDNGLNNSGGCNGPMVPTGQFREDIVNCGTQSTPITQLQNFPRAVTTNRVETRSITRNVPTTVTRPVTKFRNETTMVPTTVPVAYTDLNTMSQRLTRAGGNETRMMPVNRQVPYTDMELTTVNRPVTQQYSVNVPQTTIVNETRPVTKFIQTQKKCRVKKPIYARICDTDNRNDNFNNFNNQTSFNDPLNDQFNNLNLNNTYDQFNNNDLNATYDQFGNRTFY